MPLVIVICTSSMQGRMGLHYAAAIAEHDDRGMYDWLTDEYSADEGKLDKVNLVKCIRSICTFRLMDTTTFPANEVLKKMAAFPIVLSVSYK